MNATLFLSCSVSIGAMITALSDAGDAEPMELSVEDFEFDCPLGSQGAEIERTDRNHFKVTLGHAPEHGDWSKMLQVQIKQNAKGNLLTLDVVFNGGDAYRFNSYS